VSWEHLLKQAEKELGAEYQNTYSEFLESLGEKEKELEQQSYEHFIGGLLSVSNGPSASPDLFSFFRNKVGVSCFATNPSSVVMWSHYANEHTGICVEFSRSTMLLSAKFLELLHPVRYTEKFWEAFRLLWTPPEYFHQVPMDVLPILAACHKSKEWEYEHEWRLVSLDPAGDPRFPLDFKPSRIILGARIERADRAAIEELAQRISVPVINAQLAKDRFKIEF
jgi:hypothetical protein